MVYLLYWVIAIPGHSVCWCQLRRVLAQEGVAGDWPREIKTSEGTVIIYQPQPEKLDGNQLKSRAAVAVELKDSKDPVFGAVWFDARLETDRAERMATIVDVKVTQARFPKQNKQLNDKLVALLEQEIPKWNLPISMDQLLTSLEVIDKRAKSAEKISTKPPKILFVAEPAVLITIDGKPRLQPVDNSKLMRVINTPFTILLDSASKTYYLNADAKTWYAAKEITGQWSVVRSVPSEVAKHTPKEPPKDKEKEVTDQNIKSGPPPKIIVDTEPTELISSNGNPEYTPISGTDLLAMSNTDSDVIMEVQSQKFYVLLAGRWYTSNKLDGLWKYIRGENLPADFAKIPEDSEMATVLYAVPGTRIAKEAVLDAQIPQTAK